MSFKCPKCGRDTIDVCVNINHDADILGCEECLPPELNNEDIVLLFETDLKEMDIWLEGMEEEEEDEEYYDPNLVYARYEGEE